MLTSRFPTLERIAELTRSCLERGERVDITGLGSFYLAVQDGSFDAMGLLFTGMTIAPVAAPCPADLNGDGEVNGADLGILLAAWGGGGAADINGSGTVDGADLGILLAAWGSCG